MKLSTQKLYEVFAKYPLRKHIEGCSCCISADDQWMIQAVSSKRLTSEELARYAFKAMTTWGNVNDFKHFLPRLFELLVLEKEKCSYDREIILHKLTYADWQKWSREEQEAIQNFLKVWWADYLLQKTTYFDVALFLDIYQYIKNLQRLLDLWEVSIQSNGFRHFVRFVTSQLNYLLNDKRLGKRGDNEVDKQIILDWANAQKQLLEDGFFFYESKEPVFAEQISDALFLLENCLVAI